MTDPVARQVLTELYGEQGWPAQGEELLHHSLGPRAPELLLEAPGWLGLTPARPGPLRPDQTGARRQLERSALTPISGAPPMGILPDT